MIRFKFLVVLLLFLLSEVVFGQDSLTVVWMENTEPDLAGYRLWYAGDGVTNRVVVPYAKGVVPRFEKEFIWVTALDTAGNESDPSYVIRVQGGWSVYPYNSFKKITGGVDIVDSDSSVHVFGLGKENCYFKIEPTFLFIPDTLYQLAIFAKGEFVHGDYTKLVVYSMRDSERVILDTLVVDTGDTFGWKYTKVLKVDSVLRGLYIDYINDYWDGSTGEDRNVYVRWLGEKMSFLQDYTIDRKSTRLNSSHIPLSRMPSSA